MGLSIIVIGRNSESTISVCLGSIRRFAEHHTDIDIELLYVDSASSDSSIDIAESCLIGCTFLWTIVVVESPKHSAALGRHIGMQIARYDDLLFVDSDMVIDHAWLGAALQRREYRILTGQRFEVNIDNTACWLIDEKYYKSIDLGKIKRPGGLFLLLNANSTPARFSVFLTREEEADFVAQDPMLQDNIYRTSEVAFIHLNRKKNDLLSRLFENIWGMPDLSVYICGRIHAIRYGYYHRLLKSSYFYEVGAVCSLLIYLGISASNFIFLFIAMLFVLLSERKMSIIYRSIFFPFELIFGLFRFFKTKNQYKIRYSLVSSNIKK